VCGRDPRAVNQPPTQRRHVLVVGMTSVERRAGNDSEVSYVEDTLKELFNKSNKNEQERFVAVVTMMDYDRNIAKKRAERLW